MEVDLIPLALLINSPLSLANQYVLPEIKIPLFYVLV